VPGATASCFPTCVHNQLDPTGILITCKPGKPAHHRDTVHRPPKLILASTSPRRRELLATLGIDFTIVPSPYQEKEEPGMELAELVEFNAWNKARAVAESHPDGLVIGADTMVGIDGIALGKPANREQAADMLRKLSGRDHRVITGVSLQYLLHNGTPETDITFHVTTRVWFRTLSDEDIAAYHDVVDPMDKAGAYAMQELGERIIERIEGSPSNVIGLPLEELTRHLLPLLGKSPGQ